MIHKVSNQVRIRTDDYFAEDKGFISVESHDDNEMVKIIIDDHEYLVLAQDMLKAIRNATNQ